MRAAVVSLTLLLAASRAAAICPNTQTWTGAVSNLWSNPLNWSGNAVPDCDAIFPAAAANQSMVNDTLTGFNSVAFTGGNYRLSGNQLSVGQGGIMQSASATVTIDVPIGAFGAQTWTFNGPPGSFTISPLANHIDAGNSLTIAGTGTHTFDSIAINQSIANVTISGVTLNLTNVTHPQFTGTVVNGPAIVNARNVVSNGGYAFNSGATLNIPVPSAFGTIALNAGSTYNVVINGTGGGQYTYLQVTDSLIGGQGAIVLGGNLVVASPFNAPIGSVFFIIDNKGTNTVVGTFAGLPEGAIINVGSNSYAISYHGGDGNDVTLTAVPPSPAIPAFDARALVMLIALLAAIGVIAIRR